MFSARVRLFVFAPSGMLLSRQRFERAAHSFTMLPLPCQTSTVTWSVIPIKRA